MVIDFGDHSYRLYGYNPPSFCIPRRVHSRAYWIPDYYMNGFTSDIGLWLSGLLFPHP